LVLNLALFIKQEAYQGERGRGRSGWYERGWGQGGEMIQVLYAHMNNKTIKKEAYQKKARKVKFIFYIN
jgi:hypothetical protein